MDVINLKLQYQIRRNDFSEIIDILRSGEIATINRDTWNLVADYMEGKIMRPKGRPTDHLAQSQNYLAWERHQELMEQGLSYDDALLAMDDSKTQKYRDSIKGQVERGAKLAKDMGLISTHKK